LPFSSQPLLLKLQLPMLLLLLSQDKPQLPTPLLLPSLSQLPTSLSLLSPDKLQL
jgi:hypothetical protein